MILDEGVNLGERAVLLDEEIVELGDQLLGLLLDLMTPRTRSIKFARQSLTLV